MTLSVNTAKIVARAHIWTKSAARQPAGGSWLDASPAADMIYNATLSRGSETPGKVTDMIGRFAKALARAPQQVGRPLQGPSQDR